MTLDMVDFINGAVVHAKAAFHALISIIDIISLPCREGFRESFQIILLHDCNLLSLAGTVPSLSRES
jgi:ammonia channel protein AmtB